MGHIVFELVDLPPAFELPGLDVGQDVMKMGMAGSGLCHGCLEPAAFGLAGVVSLAGFAQKGLEPANVHIETIECLKGQVDIQPSDFFLGVAIAFGFLNLPFQRLHLTADFRQNIGEPQHVLPGGFEFSQGFRLAGLVSGRTGRLFDEPSAFFRSGFGDGADVSLLNESIGSSAHTASHEDIVNVFQPARLLVDQIGTLAGSVNAAGQHDFRKIAERFRRRSIVVDECQRDFGHVHHRDAGGAGKDDIFHGLAAKLPDTLLSHDPSEGVHHIALAAPVRADHSGYAGGKVQAGFFVKGFESGYFELFKLHVILLLLRFQSLFEDSMQGLVTALKSSIHCSQTTLLVRF